MAKCIKSHAKVEFLLYYQNCGLYPQWGLHATFDMSPLVEIKCVNCNSQKKQLRSKQTDETSKTLMLDTWLLIRAMYASRSRYQERAKGQIESNHYLSKESLYGLDKLSIERQFTALDYVVTGSNKCTLLLYQLG